MPSDAPKVALLYDDNAYVEILGRPKAVAPQRMSGLMGRQVAGREFLDAYLSHGTWNELVALVRDRRSRASLVAFCRAHPSSRLKQRRLQIFPEQEFHRTFFPAAPAALVHAPYPMEPRYAWARMHAGPGSFALSGVTHTLSSETAVKLLLNLVVAPYEPYDALICTSRAVLQMVR